MKKVLPFLVIIFILLLSTWGSIKTSKHQPVVTHSDTYKPTGKRGELNKQGDYLKLPYKWCGSEPAPVTITYDRDINHPAPHSNNSNTFKFYYVRASDQPNNFRPSADKMQLSVNVINNYFYLITNKLKVPRWDMGTNCGKNYLNIENIQLPHPASYYRNNDGSINKETTMTAIYDSTYDFNSTSVFYFDNISTVNQTRGWAEVKPNYYNKKYAWIFPPPSDIKYDMVGNGPAPITSAILHEITHTMGAVDTSAPRATSNYHCTDGFDLMCYNDGTPQGKNLSLAKCTIMYPYWQYQIEPFDCGENDYFNPSPAPNNYLTTHANVYHSPMLTNCIRPDIPCDQSLYKAYNGNGDQWRRITFNNKGKLKIKHGDVYIYTRTFAQKNNFKVKSLYPLITLPRGNWSIKSCHLFAVSVTRCQTNIVRTKKSKRYQIPSLISKVGLFKNNYVSGKLTIVNKTNKHTYAITKPTKPIIPVW